MEHEFSQWPSSNHNLSFLVSVNTKVFHVNQIIKTMLNKYESKVLSYFHIISIFHIHTANSQK